MGYNKEMDARDGKIRAIFAGLYTWAVTLYFGLVLLDIVYSKRVSGAAAVFADVSDVLLYVIFLIFIFALGAIAVSWKSRAARYCTIASLLILLSEILLPAVLTLFIRNAQNLSWVRILPAGAASILAFIGFYQFVRSTG
jgi:hypothetical protein